MQFPFCNLECAALAALASCCSWLRCCCCSSWICYCCSFSLLLLLFVGGVCCGKLCSAHALECHGNCCSSPAAGQNIAPKKASFIRLAYPNGAAFISCLLLCGPRLQGSARSPPRRRRRGGRGWRRLRHRPYRSRLEAYAKLCFLLFQCLENAAARRASFAPSLFVSSSFPVPVPVLARPSSWLSRVGGVCSVLLLLLVLPLLLCNCNFQG